MTVHILLTKYAKNIDWQSLMTSFTTYSSAMNAVSNSFRRILNRAKIAALPMAMARLSARHFGIWLYRSNLHSLCTDPFFFSPTRSCHVYASCATPAIALLPSLYVFTDCLWLNLHTMVDFRLAYRQSNLMGKTQLVVRALFRRATVTNQVFRYVYPKQLPLPHTRILLILWQFPT